MVENNENNITGANSQVVEAEQPQQQSVFPSNVQNTGYNMYSGMSNENYPVAEGDQMMNSLMSDKNIPKSVLNKYWWVFAKDVVLTFLDKDRKKAKLLAFDISRINYLLTLPYYQYDWKIEQELDNIRNIYDIKLDRALGTDKSTQINERIAQRSQFSEQRQTMSEGGSGTVRDGFLSRMLRRK